eukprot:XP_011441263.1 PREDICTED: uncharacterized protein LOC105337994 isoform X3 [Crassostrea gigas]
MADLLKPTKSSRLKERTLTDTKISLNKEKSSMSTSRAGSDVGDGSEVKNGIDVAKENDNVRKSADINEKQISDVLKEAKAIDENDLDEYDPDLFITEEEKKAFDYMLEQKRAEIVQRKETFQNWVDAITRRRMFALSRMRKINFSHGKRNKMYGKLEDFINEVYSGTDTPAEISSSKEDENGNISEQSNTENRSVDSSRVGSNSELGREDTGFVSRDLDQTPTVVPDQTPHVAQLHT